MEKKRGLESHSIGKKFGVHTVDPRQLKMDPEFNVRQDYGNLEELKESIKINGIRVPIRVYINGDDLFIVDGFRRTRAVMELISEGIDFKGIPAICETKNYSEKDRIFDMILCNDGKNLNMLEMGIAFNRLVNYGYNQTEIASKIGKTPAHVSNCIQLTTLSKKLQNVIIEGKAACSTVLNAIREADGDEDLVLAAIEENIAKPSENNGNGNGKATSGAVKRTLDPNRITPAKRMKEVQEFLDARNTESYNRDPIYMAIKQTLEYVKEGKGNLLEIGELLGLE